MIDTIKSRYKVDKSPDQISYEQQLGLKHNEEYRQRVEQTFLQIVNLFIDRYQGVSIEPPRGREKSLRSLKGKIDKLEIERLCKLYAIEGISLEEKQRLCNLIISKIDQNSEIDRSKEIQEKINNLFYKDIKSFEQIQDLAKEKQLSDNMKTACLRVAKIRLQNGELEKNEKIINSIEEQYGKEATIREKKAEKNLLHWECVEEVQEDKAMQEKLHKPMEYLKAKDLRAFKIVIANVPDELKTENKRIQRVIEKRKEASTKELTKYNDMCCIEVEKDFANYLLNNPQILQDLNVEIPKDGYKRKDKENGYIADHIKFQYLDNPEYTFELQLRSIYREELSRANGPAAHDKRSGKERIFPSVENKEEFLKELKEMTPSYTILENRQNGYRIKRCNLMGNMLEYYMGYIKLNSIEYMKAMEYVKEEVEREK